MKIKAVIETSGTPVGSFPKIPEWMPYGLTIDKDQVFALDGDKWINVTVSNLDLDDKIDLEVVIKPWSKDWRPRVRFNKYDMKINGALVASNFKLANIYASSLLRVGFDNFGQGEFLLHSLSVTNPDEEDLEVIDLHIPENSQQIPRFTIQPRDQIYNDGDQIELLGLATGNPEPNYRWQRMVHGVWQYLEGQDSHLIQFNPASIEDSGVWRLEAYNSMGSSFSKSVSLSLQSESSSNWTLGRC